MKTLMKTMSPLAVAIGLAIGAGPALAQQAGADQPRAGQSAIDQPGQSRPEAAQPGSNLPEANQPRQNQPGRDPSDADSAAGADRSVADDRQAANRNEDRDAGQDGGLEQIAEENSDLSQFVEAVKAAGLEDALTGDTEYTVFAPTNSALEDADIESLMEPENRSDLVALLRAHIVADDVDQELAGRIAQAQTIDGGTVDISAEGDRIMIGGNEAKEAEGLELGNLRVYAVDEVLSRGRAGESPDSQAANRPGDDRQRSVTGRAEADDSDRSAPN